MAVIKNMFVTEEILQYIFSYIQLQSSVIMHFSLTTISAHQSLTPRGEKNNKLQLELCFSGDDEKAKRDAGKWWKPWVSKPGGEQRGRMTTGH